MSAEQTLIEYLATIKPGDIVLVRQGISYKTTQHGVVKVTKTQIVTIDNKRFNRVDGSEIGGAKWARLGIVAPTEENRKAEAAPRLRRWATENFPDAFAKLSIEQQLEIYKLVTTQIAEIEADQSKAAS
ncbi:hypothetical protein [Pseudomonas sp. MWU12-2323]|uniref:hypothetical protein n=1 Tax=Pseudomonas sp. MWU12-2323 TaxID=2651296 RepID=UPI00128D1DA1|nr:hypothetical protein [Pseudomonas sp. MWU12-2323]MPQ69470.1 hypothetical protein [Pseudomonas sp. MWU12-2323]